MSSMSRLLQDNSCGKNSWKSIKYSQSYDTVCQLALLGIKGFLPFLNGNLTKMPAVSGFTFIYLIDFTIKGGKRWNT